MLAISPTRVIRRGSLFIMFFPGHAVPFPSLARSRWPMMFGVTLPQNSVCPSGSALICLERSEISSASTSSCASVGSSSWKFPMRAIPMVPMLR